MPKLINVDNNSSYANRPAIRRSYFIGDIGKFEIGEFEVRKDANYLQEVILKDGEEEQIIFYYSHGLHPQEKFDGNIRYNLKAILKL